VVLDVDFPTPLRAVVAMILLVVVMMIMLMVINIVVGWRRRRDHNRRRSRASRDHYDGRERQRPGDTSAWINRKSLMDMEVLKLSLVQFENSASYNRWSRSVKVAHLRWSLTGTAAQLLWGSEGVSYEE